MIEIHSDGSSSGQKNCRLAVDDTGGRVWLGPGGYGWILSKDGRLLYSGYDGHHETTNNIMEMTGALEGFKALETSGIWTVGEPVTLVSDSEYTLNIANGRYQPTKNLDLAKALRSLVRRFQAKTRWVRGHQYKRGTPYALQARDVLLNERCDQLAKMGREKYSR